MNRTIVQIDNKSFVQSTKDQSQTTNHDLPIHERGIHHVDAEKVKHRKQMRGRMTGTATRGSEISFGEYGLKCLEPAWITDRQIEAARIAMTRHIKRGGKIWIRMFPDKPVTKKPAETRMGKGKGRTGILGSCSQTRPHPLRD